jgi:dolichol-phosphate mannosyltransferase
MQTKNISVIIPSYLEEENLRVIIPRLQTTLSELHCTYEILIVDTMKPMDNTKKVCDMYGDFKYD